jgi:uncharacterized protein (TIGR03435 family)
MCIAFTRRTKVQVRREHSMWSRSSASQDRRPGALRYLPTGVDFSSGPLPWVIGEAYEVPYGRISSREPQVRELLFEGTHFYDIIARTDQPAPKAQLRLMLRTLLADRFKMNLRQESKVESVYKLVVAKDGTRLKASAVDGDLPVIAGGQAGFDFRNMEMARFAGFLSTYIGRPVVDFTGLTGRYDFALKLEGADNSTPDKAALAEWMSLSIFGDIQRQLGLRLDADKAPVEYLVVDHIEKPSDN